MPLTKGNQEIYTHLAVIYDEVMREIDYDDWADYIDALIQKHNENAETILELACGTGSLALSLDELDCYDILATDFSQQMLEAAKSKASYKNATVSWKQLDFFNIQLVKKFDIVLMLFDSVNYIRDPQSIKEVFTQVKKVLKPDGVFIFDFTTPQHSKKHAELMNDQGLTPDNYRFVRVSRYLETDGMHYNEFVIEKLSDDKQTVLDRKREVHVQKTYTFNEIKNVVDAAGMEVIAAYDDLDFIEATEQSDRVTMVIR
jgi:ubiquinone/menaquinone biosynthesis C-methylase UbiE